MLYVLTNSSLMGLKPCTIMHGPPDSMQSFSFMETLLSPDRDYALPRPVWLLCHQWPVVRPLPLRCSSVFVSWHSSARPSTQWIRLVLDQLDLCSPGRACALVNWVLTIDSSECSRGRPQFGQDKVLGNCSMLRGSYVNHDARQTVSDVMQEPGKVTEIVTNFSIGCRANYEDYFQLLRPLYAVWLVVLTFGLSPIWNCIVNQVVTLFWKFLLINWLKTGVHFVPDSHRSKSCLPIPLDFEYIPYIVELRGTVSLLLRLIERWSSLAMMFAMCKFWAETVSMLDSPAKIQHFTAKVQHVSAKPTEFTRVF